MKYIYPTKEQIEADVAFESQAITTAMTAISESLDDCPLKDHYKVYALCELACKLCPAKYVEEVVNEIWVLSEYKK